MGCCPNPHKGYFSAPLRSSLNERPPNAQRPLTHLSDKEQKLKVCLNFRRKFIQQIPERRPDTRSIALRQFWRKVPMGLQGMVLKGVRGQKSPRQTVKKPTLVSRKGSGNEAFPDWNPQDRLRLSEEKGEFQGFLRFFRKLME